MKTRAGIRFAKKSFVLTVILLVTIFNTFPVQKATAKNADLRRLGHAYARLHTTAVGLSPLLPASLYYLAETGSIFNGIKVQQIYRLGQDGKTITRITNEKGWGIPINFDVSPLDGTIAYGSGHQVITVDPNGKHRRVLLQNTEDVFWLLWSPDGKSIVYQSATGGLYLYRLVTKHAELLLSGTIGASPRPQSFSPDGKKLLVDHLASALDGAIYDFASRKITAIPPWHSTGKDIPVCENRVITWSTPASFFCSGPMMSAGTSLGGLWRVNANTGSIKALVADPKLPFQWIGAPRQDLTGKLYYLYGQYQDPRSLPTLSLMRSASDGIAGRVALRPEKFIVRQAFWTPGNTGLVILEMDNYAAISGLILVPMDPALPVTTLVTTGAADITEASFRWGP